MNAFVVELPWHVDTGTKDKPAIINGHVIKPQPNKWGCGPWSLRYCLMKWGIDIDPYQLARMAQSTKKGTTNRHLEYAAMQLGARVDYVDTPYVTTAKREIDRMLAEGQALILNFDGGSPNFRHWVACLHRLPYGYLILDPSPYQPVVQLKGWNRLKAEMKHTLPEDDHRDFHYIIIGISRPDVVHRHKRAV